MTARIQQEIELLRGQFPYLEHVPNGNWVRILAYPLPAGWSRETSDVAFQIPPAYPGTHPYGVYVPIGLQFRGAAPANYKEPADNKPPFSGQWGIFSWQPEQWRATADLNSGHNLLNWVTGFTVRFNEGK